MESFFTGKPIFNIVLKQAIAFQMLTFHLGEVAAQSQKLEVQEVESFSQYVAKQCNAEKLETSKGCPIYASIEDLSIQGCGSGIWAPCGGQELKMPQHLVGAFAW